jgi:hypothetical protein
MWNGRTDGHWYTIIRPVLKTGVQKSANQKQELPVVAMFVNGQGQNVQSLERTFYRCFLRSFSSFGRGVSEEKIKMWKVNGRWTPSDGKSSYCLWQGELKKGAVNKSLCILQLTWNKSKTIFIYIWQQHSNNCKIILHLDVDMFRLNIPVFCNYWSDVKWKWKFNIIKFTTLLT